MGWITGEGEIENSYKISKIAAHVPGLVVYSTLTNKIPYAEFHGVLLFVDVSDKLISVTCLCYNTRACIHKECRSRISSSFKTIRNTCISLHLQ
uniref:Uncharacterized protein n=1 Tax=Oncorhynchus mykiss TaxID=8022 RepID=A0A8C7RAG7_ONCMY